MLVTNIMKGATNIRILDLAFSYLQQNQLISVCDAGISVLLDRHVSRESSICGKVRTPFVIYYRL